MPIIPLFKTFLPYFLGNAKFLNNDMKNLNWFKAGRPGLHRVSTIKLDRSASDQGEIEEDYLCKNPLIICLTLTNLIIFFLCVFTFTFWEF